VEPLFANIKQDLHSSPFMLRAIEKVTGEAGMVALAYNLGRKEA
jgi:hypothetical protein